MSNKHSELRRKHQFSRLRILISEFSFLNSEHLSVVLEANEDGYLASVPGVQGAFAEGDTVGQAIFNCIDVVKLVAAYRRERGESLGFRERCEPSSARPV